MIYNEMYLMIYNEQNHVVLLTCVSMITMCNLGSGIFFLWE